MPADSDLSVWFEPLSRLTGIGPKLAEKVQALIGGDRLVDLAFYQPNRWVDRSLKSSFDLLIEGEVQTVCGEIQSFEGAARGSKVQKVRLSDETGFLTLVFFNSNTDYLKRQFPIGQRIHVSGRIEDFHGQRQMTHPDYVVPEARAHEIPLVEPVYPLQAGITNKRMIGFIRQALEILPQPREWLSGDVLKQQGWPDFMSALKTMHEPVELIEEDIHLARQRLAYDEAFARALRFRQIRAATAGTDAIPLIPDRQSQQDFATSLPYPLTGAQKRVMEEVQTDLSRSSPMQRMLQGDVGSGKTTIAAYASYVAAQTGHQVAVMAPTEVLARQLAHSLKVILEPLNMSVECLTGRDKGKARKQILEDAATGQTQVLCGTHALFQTGVDFQNLALVIIDEQHRFGVQDRGRLTDKGQSPHLLLMSATPIPRSLSMTIHGDVDLSILDEKPPGRQKIDTRTISNARAGDVIDGVRRAVGRGEQVFWVCPNVEEDDEHMSAMTRYAILDELMPGRVGLVHGRLSAQAKNTELERFRDGEVSVLVATTVIEVGVDVPNATIMVIEGAEKFGLAQLHQLRGRVGRGSKPSFCLLIYTAPLGVTATKRLQTIRDSEDGFYIAEMDFKLRGPGDILGLEQSGMPDFRFINLVEDQDLLALANRHSEYLINRVDELPDEINLLLELYSYSDDLRPTA